MTKRFHKSLDKAWFQYQDLYDRHMVLLRDIGDSASLEMLQEKYEDEIERALNQWSTPQERFDSGSYTDFDLGLDDEDF